ncbi:MAG TPA: hypothetical protein P5139_11190 [Tenuifilum sp.]|nr:hypothetical protein [Tenuifilum sp.]
MEESKRINGVYLKADLSGVHEIDSVDLAETDEISSPKNFFDKLNNLNECEIVISFFDGDSEELYDEIEKTHGITLLSKISTH